MEDFPPSCLWVMHGSSTGHVTGVVGEAGGAYCVPPPGGVDVTCPHLSPTSSAWPQQPALHLPPTYTDISKLPGSQTPLQSGPSVIYRRIKLL